MNLEIKAFYNANAPLADGFRRKELLSISDDEFEQSREFIHWAFPTSEPSQQFPNAPVLDLASAIWLAEKTDFSEFLEDMAVRFLDFLSAQNHWKCHYNHNHLRISRAIQSLRVLHSWELANWFHSKVKELADDSFSLMQEADSYWAYHASPIHDRIAGAFVGLAIGDALGAPVEFSPRGTFSPVTVYRSGGRFNLPAGAWTDDTAMALCLAQSIIENDSLQNDDLLNRFCDWAAHGSNTSTGVAVGIGQNTLRVLGDYRRNGYLEARPFGSKNDGNGSLMRLAPVACYAYSDVNKARRLASEQSKSTHASRPADESCQLLAELLCMLIDGHSLTNALKGTSQREWGQLAGSIFKHPYAEEVIDDVTASGFVIETLHAALWSVINADNFETAVLKAVNLGDDADTVGAVAGQLAGAIFGYSAVPKYLKSGLSSERSLYVTSQFLARLE
ncbi:ADP-ribosylglycohydrolase family protein [Yoonia sp. MH D7]